MGFNEIVSETIVICGLLTGLAAVVGLVIKMVKTVKAPNDNQNARISECEARLSTIEKALRTDAARFNKMEESNRIIQKGLLALLAHGIDGNEIDSLRDAKKDLQDYLIKNQ